MIERLRPEHILHLGDATEPWVVHWLEEFVPRDAVHAVQGDNDSLDLNLLPKKVIEIAGCRIGLIHGHRHWLKELPSIFVNKISWRFGRLYWIGFFSDLFNQFTWTLGKVKTIGHRKIG